jgi:hypothetical protein
MAYWFHRNPLKATAPVTFELRGASTSGPAQKICNELRQARNILLDIISNPNNEISTLSSALDNYLSLLHGFIVSMDGETTADSKLRHAVRFRWTNTLLGNTPTEQYDTAYERVSMMFNVALWYMKHCLKFAGVAEPKMEEAKEVHKCLRTAAGIFTAIKNEYVAQLIETPEKGADLDPRVLDAYIHQCTAEAQEVTIARAIELKHSSSLVSALAHETAQLYTSADSSLKTLADDKVALKWRKYLQFKTEIYLAYAYNFHGETLLAQDKCGDAIKCLEESQSHYNKAGQLAKDYASTKGAGATAKPQEHLFFRKLAPIVQRTLDKCVRENGFIYHQKVPPVAPDLELKATFGLVAPEEFKLPTPNTQWTADVYKAFDISKMPSRDASAPKKDGKPGVQGDGAGSGDLPPVKETDVSQSNKDPNTFSGCTVS